MIVDIQTSKQQEQKGKKDNQTIVNHFSRILKEEDMYYTNNNSLYSHCSGTKRIDEERNYRKRNDRDYIATYVQFESVCKEA